MEVKSNFLTFIRELNYFVSMLNDVYCMIHLSD